MSLSAPKERLDESLSFHEGVRVIRRFWAFVRPYRGKFFLSIGLLLCAVPLSQFALFLTRDVTNQALLATGLSADERWSTVLTIVGIQSVFFLVSASLSTWREVLEWYGSMRATFDVRMAFYRHLHRLPLAFLSRRLPGEHLFRSTTDMVSVFRIANRPAAPTASGQSPPDSKEVAMAVYSNDVDPYDPGMMGMIVRTMPFMVETLYSLSWGLALLFLIDPTLTLFLTAYVVPFTLVSHFLFNRVRKAAFAYKEASEVETGALRDSIAGLRTLKAMGRTKLQKQRYLSVVINARRRAIQQIVGMVTTQSGAQMGMKWLFSICVYVYLTKRVMDGQATLGDWVAAFLLIEAAQGPLENFIQLIQLIKMQLVPAQRILETLDEEPKIADKPGAKEIGQITGAIELSQVSFSYVPGRRVLRELSLKIEPGQYIGIVGPSGAGKSSVLSLLLRLYLPDSGQVLYDGNDIRDLKIQSLLDQIGTVPQNTILYHGTLEDNVLFGNPKASQEEFERALHLSGVADFAKRMPQGMLTEAAEGASISGGEKQRVGIARALVRSPKILLLDEATANLDPATEAGVLASINGLRDGRTIISVAHRLKAVVPCDRIIVLDQGEIVQSGTHDELVRQEGIYRILWLEQSDAPWQEPEVGS